MNRLQGAIALVTALLVAGVLPFVLLPAVRAVITRLRVELRDAWDRGPMAGRAIASFARWAVFVNILMFIMHVTMLCSVVGLVGLIGEHLGLGGWTYVLVTGVVLVWLLPMGIALLSRHARRGEHGSE